MDQGTEPIRQDIDQLRSSMTDKMERIEAKIKGSVDDTTHSVKQLVDIKYQVSEHPWAALGISVLAGVALGSMGGSDASDTAPTHNRSYNGNAPSSAAAYEQARSVSPYPPNEGSNGHSQPSEVRYGVSDFGSPSYGNSQYRAGMVAEQHAKPGVIDQITSQFGDEIEMLKTAAVTSVIALLRDTIQQSFPTMHREMERQRRPVKPDNMPVM